MPNTISGSKMQSQVKDTQLLLLKKEKFIHGGLVEKTSIYWWKYSSIHVDRLAMELTSPNRSHVQLNSNNSKVRPSKESQQVATSASYSMTRTKCITGAMDSMLLLEMARTKIMKFLYATISLITCLRSRKPRWRRWRAVSHILLDWWTMASFTDGALMSTDKWALNHKLVCKCTRLSILPQKWSDKDTKIRKSSILISVIQLSYSNSKMIKFGGLVWK